MIDADCDINRAPRKRATVGREDHHVRLSDRRFGHRRHAVSEQSRGAMAPLRHGSEGTRFAARKRINNEASVRSHCSWLS